jgi:H/ACA ribonucleoprotein complex subunit 4
MKMKREFLTKSEAITNPAFGSYPGIRTISELLENGFIILDKWRGPTSHDVVATVKKILGVKKAGHAGTLDPMSSGVLLITLNNACKVMPLLKGLDKEYVAVMHLHKDVETEALKNTLNKFQGEITQVPPVKSAVKRKARKRKIFSLKYLDRKGRNVVLQLSCEAGTYVRKLIHDMGRELGGAHMKELRRIRVGSFREDEAKKIQDLKDSFVFWKKQKQTSNEVVGQFGEGIREIILPIEYALRDTKLVFIKDSAVNKVCNGAPLASGGITKIQKDIKKGDRVGLMSLKGELVALGTSLVDASSLKRGLVVKTDRVVMKKGTYPS